MIKRLNNWGKVHQNIKKIFNLYGKLYLELVSVLI